MEKILIANRGEIAVRIIRACRDLGIKTVAVYSQADKESLAVLLADEAICIGKPQAAHSYLNIPSILSAAEVTHADGIHPGYGFLSENAHFAEVCEEAGITFIGPSADTIHKLGDKANAKAIAKQAGAPTIPGSDGVVKTLEAGMQEAVAIGFPVFIKASAGGGGKGIRIAHSKEEFNSLFVAAQNEAQAAFGNPDVYLEKMIVNPRHVEVQVLGDTQGNYVYLGERDCTIQRRRQKLIEEAPSPLVDDAMRKKMGEAAVAIVKAAGYHTAGTVEFLLDEEKNFYFMEVNTRIQVEHTVTEELTGVDLLKEQIKTAAGETLSFSQKDVTFNGHVIEYRINAEDPTNGFSPSPGRLEYFSPSGGPHVRVDTACYTGYSIPPYYDSMIAKLIVKGRTREEAIAHSKRALREFLIGGIQSTIPFHEYMLNNERYLSGEGYTIGYIDDLSEKGCTFEP